VKLIHENLFIESKIGGYYTMFLNYFNLHLVVNGGINID